MNKTDRLLAIVLELQVKKQLTALQISQIFEVSKRTIYRDIQALCESGVPIMAKQGEGYALADNYFLPPISFTPSETNTLLLGLDFIRNTFDEEYGKIATQAENKIRVILSDELNKKADEIKKRFHIVSLTNNFKENSLYNDILKKIRTAILKEKKLLLHYHSKKEESVRKVAPCQLALVGKTWYLTAFCYEKNALRNFRLDRVIKIDILEEFFDYSFFDSLKINYGTSRTEEAILHFLPNTKRWLEEESFYYVENIVDKNDYLEVTLKYRQNDEVIKWLMSWGSKAKVITPASLKNLVIEETKKILDQYI